MSAIQTTVVFEFTETSPNNLTLRAIYRQESDADLFIADHDTEDLVKRTMMFTDEEMVMLEATADFHLPMNF